MAAAHAGIVDHDTNHQQQQHPSMAVIAEPNGASMEQQLEEQYSFLSNSSQNQSLSQMVATYSTNDMVRS